MYFSLASLSIRLTCALQHSVGLLVDNRVRYVGGAAAPGCTDRTSSSMAPASIFEHSVGHVGPEQAQDAQGRAALTLRFAERRQARTSRVTCSGKAELSSRRSSRSARRFRRSAFAIPPSRLGASVRLISLGDLRVEPVNDNPVDPRASAQPARRPPSAPSPGSRCSTSPPGITGLGATDATTIGGLSSVCLLGRLGDHRCCQPPAPQRDLSHKDGQREIPRD